MEKVTLENAAFMVNLIILVGCLDKFLVFYKFLDKICIFGLEDRLVSFEDKWGLCLEGYFLFLS